MQEYESTEKEMKETAQEPKKAVDGFQKIEDTVTGGYKKIEDAVTGSYRKMEKTVVDGFLKMEDGIVSGFNRVSDKCVEKMFSREGETVEETKERLKNAGKKQEGEN